MTLPLPSADAERVRHLVRLDARHLVDRFEGRLDTMVHVFSRLRDRDALTAPVHSLLPTLRFADLVILEPEEQEAVLAFARVVEEMRWYLRYTEHMPGALSDALEGYRRALQTAYATLLTSLAPPALARAPDETRVKAPARKATKKSATKKSPTAGK